MTGNGPGRQARNDRFLIIPENFLKLAYRVCFIDHSDLSALEPHATNSMARN